MDRSVDYQGQILTYALQYKKVKHITLRVYDDLRIAVSAPRRLKKEEIDRYVQQKGAWILQSQHKINQRKIEKAQYGLRNRYTAGGYIYFLGDKIPLILHSGISTQLIDGQLFINATDDSQKIAEKAAQFYQSQSIIIFRKLNDALYPHLEMLGIKKATIAARRMSASWGRCHVQKGHIVLNTQLIQAPKECIISVLLHEYVHFLHPNHGKEFKRLLYELMPEYDQWTERLNLLISLS